MVKISSYNVSYLALQNFSIKIIQVALILTGLNSALCRKNRASYTAIGNKKDSISLSFSLNLSDLSIIIIIIQFMVILTGLNSALCCKGRASYTEIGNKKDYISCCDNRFQTIQRSSDNL